MENQQQYLTVTALTKYIKFKFDCDVNLAEVFLEGEISNFKHNSRGHFYFTLKDDGAQISATMFASAASKVKFEPADGMHVFVKGNISVYEPSGTYQINVKELKADGIGDLYLAYEKLKADLEKEGFFRIEHKKPLPRFPQVVGVITSPTGAAVRDIINTIGRRWKMANIILYPAIVQGDDAKKDIVKQIHKANHDKLCDVLIVGRGGGSIEDLWAFNERIVAEAIYESEIPIISAVGHEIDFTIADFVADMRAATPTAAAEIATPTVEMCKQNINYYVDALTKKINFMLNEKKLMLANIDKRIENNNPLYTLKHKRELLDNYTQSLNILIHRLLEAKKYQFDVTKARLEAVNPLAIMDKGYSINSVNDEIITDVKRVKKGDKLTTKMKNGTIISEITDIIEKVR